MEPEKRKKVLALFTNKVFSVALSSNQNPTQRLRQIEFYLDEYADTILKDYITELTKRYPKVETKIDGQ